MVEGAPEAPATLSWLLIPLRTKIIPSSAFSNSNFFWLHEPQSSAGCRQRLRKTTAQQAEATMSLSSAFRSLRRACRAQVMLSQDSSQQGFISMAPREAICPGSLGIVCPSLAIRGLCHGAKFQLCSDHFRLSWAGVMHGGT